MALDQVANFVRVTVDGTHTSGDSTVSLKSGEASELPDVSNGKYNLVWFDSKNHRRPDSDPEAEIVRVNSIDTSTDTISVTRGRENTTATAKDTSPATYELFLGPTAKTITDIGSQKLDKNQRYSDSEARTAVDGSSVSLNHDNLTGVSSADHHSKTSSASELTDVSPDSTSSAHHSRYSDEEAQDAVGTIVGNALSYDDVNNSVDVSESNISHDNISGVSSSDHHSKTSSASELTDVSPDSTSSAHHSRYSDEEAQDAVGTIVGNALSYDDANNSVDVSESNISHDNISGVSSSDHHSRYSDSEARTAVDGSSVSLNHDNLAGVSSADHHSRYSDEEAQDAVGTIVGNALSYDDANNSVDVSESNISHDNISGVSSSDHHSRYSDSEARTAVDGSSVSLNHDNLTGVSSADHHSRYSNEEARDAVGNIISGSTDISVNYDDGSNSITVDHNNTSNQGNVSTGGATVIDDVNLDGRGHVTNLNTQNRSISDWGAATSNIDLSNNSITGVNNIVINDTGVTEGLTFPGFTLAEEDAGDLIIRDTVNNVDLIRQPKAGPTQFIQGADIGSIEAPEDSLTQLANASVTSASSSGDTVGYTFAVDNQTGIELSATSDSSGGLSNGPVAALGGDLEASDGETIWDEASTEIPDSALGLIGNSTLSNNSVTIEGNNVSLGGSTSVNHNDLSTISSNDHHSRYSDSEARTAVDGSSVSLNHDNLTGVSSADHHSKTSSASELIDVSPDSTSGAHHSRYSDEEAQDAVGTIVGNALSYDDANNSVDVSESNISHDNISGVSSSDHHSRYSDSEARTAVDGSSVSLNHDNLTGVSSADHHSRYSDSEARGAINGNIIKPKHSIHSNIIDSAITLSSDEGLDLTGPVTGSAPISGDGRFVVSGSSGSVNADTLDGLDSTDFLQVSDSVDADTVDGIEAANLGSVNEATSEYNLSDDNSNKIFTVDKSSGNLDITGTVTENSSL